MRTHLSKIEDYPAFLEACWQEHLKPKAKDAPTVISLFAGCGGSSLGYSMAGYRELLAVEWDDHAVETFKANFPDVPVYHGDIAKLSVEEALRITGLKPGELDVLDGSPPCQGFSTAGKRKMDDSRNQLFREYIRLLRGLQPKVLIMENVSGMVKGYISYCTLFLISCGSFGKTLRSRSFFPCCFFGKKPSRGENKISPLSLVRTAFRSPSCANRRTVPSLTPILFAVSGTVNHPCFCRNSRWLGIS